MRHANMTAALLSVLLAGSCWAGPVQSPKKQALLLALSANAKELQAYRWKQRTTVVRRDVPMEPTVEEIRFDPAGQPQRIVLSRPEEKRMGPLRARKAAEIKASVREAMELARRYASPQLLAEVIQKGEVWEGEGSLRVHSRSILLRGDEIVMAASSRTYLATRVEIATRHDGESMAIAIDYEQPQRGPSRMVRMVVRIRAEEIVVLVDSFDFLRAVAD